MLLTSIWYLQDLYQLGDGDWGWYERNIGHHGREYAQIPIAAVSNTWYVSAFSVSKEYGIAVIENPRVVSRDIHVYLLQLDHI